MGLSREVAISGSFGTCKGFCKLPWITTHGASGLRQSAGRNDVGAFAVGRRASGFSGSGKKPRSGQKFPRKQRPPANPVLEDGDDDAALERAMEDLFAQLEMDLESSVADSGDDEEFTEEELALMAKELQDAFDEAGLEFEGLDDEESGPKTVDMFMKDGMYSDDSVVHNRGEQEEEDEDEEGVEDEDEEDEERMVPLEKWQLRKLAAAAEKGRRNVNVKILSAELGMDRADVLSFLRNPPPELLLMSDELENEVAEASERAEAKVEKAPKVAAASRKQPAPPLNPSGGPQSPRSWHGSKRLKKEHIATFERVYRNSTRPSNAMIENLVNLTHVPRKKILQWFDDKRAENQPNKSSFENAPKIDESAN